MTILGILLGGFGFGLASLSVFFGSEEIGTSFLGVQVFTGVLFIINVLIAVSP